MIADGVVEVDAGTDERQDQNPEQDDVVPGDVPGVIGVVLGGHGTWILLSTSYRAWVSALRWRCGIGCSTALGARRMGSVFRGANPGTDSQFPANCAGNSVSVPG